MGNLCWPEQNTISFQLLASHHIVSPQQLIHSNIQKQSKQQCFGQNGELVVSSPFFPQQQHINPLKSSRSQQLDHTDNIEALDSIYPLQPYSLPVVVKPKGAFSGITNQSFKDSLSYIKQYAKHVTNVQPPSLIENSVQLSVIGDSYKLGKLMSSNLQLADSFHMKAVLSSSSSD